MRYADEQALGLLSILGQMMPPNDAPDGLLRGPLFGHQPRWRCNSRLEENEQQGAYKAGVHTHIQILPFLLTGSWSAGRPTGRSRHFACIQIESARRNNKEKKKGRLSVWVEMVGLVLKEFSRPVDRITAPQ